MGRRDDVVSDYACSLALTDDFFQQFLSVTGADSVSNGIDWWTLAMLAYPETQARAQAELDAVVGRARLPTFADLPLLTYTHSMVKEVLRWKPPVHWACHTEPQRTIGTKGCSSRRAPFASLMFGS